jgi:hypothetical protein
MVLELVEFRLDIRLIFTMKVRSRFGHDDIASHPQAPTRVLHHDKVLLGVTVPASFSLPNNCVRPCMM